MDCVMMHYRRWDNDNLVQVSILMHISLICHWDITKLALSVIFVLRLVWVEDRHQAQHASEG